MSASNKKKILVAVDGSGQAFEVVRYVSRILPPGGTEVVLFYVSTKVPESFYDSEKVPAYHYRIINIEAWEKERERLIDDFMTNSRRVFSEAGFPETSVKICLQDRKIGIAQDIVEESRKDYDVVAVGRSGLSDLRDFMLGNIAQKVVEKVSHVPVWVVGGKAVAKKILVAIDASEGAATALSHVAAMVHGEAGPEVTIFHAIRGLSILQKVYGDSLIKEKDRDPKQKVREEIEQMTKILQPSFDEGRRLLLAAGITDERIHTKVVAGVSSRPMAIVEEAENNGYDTIVVGRRGMSKVQEFFMGRISTKVLHMAKERTVWVVS